jgi:hypothetical protein
MALTRALENRVISQIKENDEKPVFGTSTLRSTNVASVSTYLRCASLVDKQWTMTTKQVTFFIVVRKKKVQKQ